MRVVAVVPAHQNEATIGATVRAVAAHPRIGEVLVVDDGSTDATAEQAGLAGARVIRLGRNLGKGAALERGFGEAGPADALMMLDGDTGESAAGAIELLDPILEGAADMVIGVLPAAGRQGGFGLVRRTAAWLIRRTSGYESHAPLSGQRAVRPEVVEACRPLARGFGVDAALTADAVRHGFRVVEVPVAMAHRHRGRSAGGFAHRARQGWDLIRAFLPRLLR